MLAGAGKPSTDRYHRVLASGIARVVSFEQTVQFTNQNREVYFKDTLCELPIVD